MKGALAGLVGGLAGAGAKILAQRLFPPRADGNHPPAVAFAEHVTHRNLDDRQREMTLQAIHFAFGALAGAVYGIMTEYEPSLAAWRGAAFGITLNRITHESVLPRMGLSRPKDELPTQDRISEWATHAVYGVTTDSVRRLVRKAL